MVRLSLFLASTSAAAIVSACAFAADLYVPELPVVEVGDTYAIEIGVAAGWLMRTGSTDELDNEDQNYGLAEFTARFGAPFADSLYAQFDLDAELAFPSGDGNAYLGSVLAAAHLGYRDDAVYAGAYAGAAYLEDLEDGSGSLLTLGVEGQAYVDNTTFYAQLGYLDTNAIDQEGLHETWYGRGVVSHFLADGNTKLQGELSVGKGLQDIDVDGGDEVIFVGWGAELEHKFDGGMSAFIAYDGIAWSEDSDGGDRDEIADHIVKVGFRWTMDDSTLQEASQSGASLSTPNIGYWSTAATALD